RPVRCIRRHDAQPDRPSDRDHRHDDGRLSFAIASHQCCDELVQCVDWPGGSQMSAEAPSYVARALTQPEPPPAMRAGGAVPIGSRLLNSPFNAALTVVSAVLVVLVLWPAARFLFVDAVWDGANRADCLPETAGHPVGACWLFIKAKLPQLMYGF